MVNSGAKWVDKLAPASVSRSEIKSGNLRVDTRFC